MATSAAAAPTTSDSGLQSLAVAQSAGTSSSTPKSSGLGPASGGQGRALRGDHDARRRTRRGEELDQWDAVKRAASDAVIEAGGTITHHHAVGRDHMPWYREQRPPLFGAALAAAKGVLDPKGILNPGVLLP